MSSATRLASPGGEVLLGGAAPEPAVDAAGWWPLARQLVSPNCDARPLGSLIELVVIHAISLPPEQFHGEGVVELFTNRLDPQAHPYYAQIAQLRVSAHFFIRRDGEVIQFVPTPLRAWHAGASQWQGRERCNDFSLGIELEGSDTQPFTTAQYAGLAQLIRVLAARHPLRALAGHSDIAPGRKTDPGPCFAWDQLVARLNQRSA